MVSHPNKNSEAEVRYSCGCFVGVDGGTYCCRRHYDLVKLLHTSKKEDHASTGKKAVQG